MPSLMRVGDHYELDIRIHTWQGSQELVEPLDALGRLVFSNDVDPKFGEDINEFRRVYKFPGTLQEKHIRDFNRCAELFVKGFESMAELGLWYTGRMLWGHEAL